MYDIKRRDAIIAAMHREEGAATQALLAEELKKLEQSAPQPGAK